jgi:hypothetical protein
MFLSSLEGLIVNEFHLCLVPYFLVELSSQNHRCAAVGNHSFGPIPPVSNLAQTLFHPGGLSFRRSMIATIGPAYALTKSR